MAKQNLQNTTSVETNTFAKGMVKDVYASLQPKENWSHARNAYNNSVDGDAGVIGNEPANLKCGVIPYTVIGAIHKQADQWYIFSTDDVSSEIGLFDDSLCQYTTIVNDPCLSFKRTHLITGAAKENYDCSWQVYWDDGNNPSRTLNVDNIPWIQQEVSEPGSDCTIYADTNKLNCEKIRLAPLVDVPCVELSRAEDGGMLRNGMYQAYIAYVVNEQKVTDYIGISNLQSLWSHLDNGGSLNIKLSNLDKDFEYFELVILSNNVDNVVAKKIGIYSTQQSSISIDYIDPALTSVPFKVLFAKGPAYEKSEAMYVVNDWLIRQGPTEQFDFNYQPLANQIKTNWVVAEYPANYYYKGGNKTGFMRDEQYAFFIRWIYNTGERSQSYHIPGRPPRLDGINQFGEIVNETAIANGINSLSADEYNFQVYNTATVTSVGINQPLPDGGIILAKGEMGYWESTEEYPSTKPEIWNSTYVDPETGVNIGGTSNTNYDLCGKKIRHHKMPTEETTPELQLSSSNANSIRILGVEFTNIKRPKYNDGTFIPNVVGYEILRGSREGAKSILAKGIFRNMREYNIPDSENLIGTSTQGLYPNYPYNDLSPDTYFHDGTGGERTDDAQSYAQSLAKYPPLSGFRKDVFTFHSPELMFKRPYLNAYETRIYGEYFGASTGYFIKSEQHPQNKLLRNGALLVAGLIGLGYALQMIRGKLNKRNLPMQVNNIGLNGYGTTPGASIITAPSAGPSNAGSGATTLALTASSAIVDVILNEVINVASVAGDIGSGGAVTDIKFNLQNKANIALGNSPGTFGGGQLVEAEGSEFRQLPITMRVLSGIPVFMGHFAVGTDEIIELFYNLVSYGDFAWKHNSHGLYSNFKKFSSGALYRTANIDSNYIGSSFQVFGQANTGLYKINNLFRPDTVAINTSAELPLPTVTDNSRYVLGSLGDSGLYNPEVKRKRNISALYGALKFNFENQYGQLEGIKQVVMRGCIEYLDPQKPMDYLYSTQAIFSGDVYVNRYTEKTIMPIFTDFLLGQPDQYPYDYLKRMNIPYPRYWMNTEKYDTSKMLNNFINVFPTTTSSYGGWAPNDLFYLDRHASSIGFKMPLFNDSDPNPMFSMKYGYMYTHVNGIQDFFVESELNIAQRDWEDRADKRHYDPYYYNNVDDLVHAEIIKEDNFYKYDFALSASRFLTNLSSYGTVQPRDYDPKIAETCYTSYPKRLIYSLQAQLEAKKDFWRVYLPNNYKDFKDRVSVIKPVDKSGAIIFFPYQSPQLFQGLDTLQTDLGTKLTIGDGGLFSQPFQNITNSDLPNEYGSCESARSVVNTPLGIFYLSQAQGKVFQFAGGLDNIANRGMKWWFNKYLPSTLLMQFPNLETSKLYDNPVAGVGCQSIYDTNDDIVYFCKKDYAVRKKYLKDVFFNDKKNQFYLNVKIPNGLSYSVPIELGDPQYFEDTSWTVSYDPKAKAWISFHDWHPELVLPSINHFLTTKTITSDVPQCPPGYNFNPVTGQCEILINESAPAVVSIDEVEALISGGPQNCLIDIVIAVDTSGSTGGPSAPVGSAERTLVQGFLDNPTISAGMAAGSIQVGITSWASTQTSMNPLGFSMSNTITSAAIDAWYVSNWYNAGTNIQPALVHAQGILNNKATSQLGDRSMQPNFRQYILFVTDTTTPPPANVGCPYQSSTLGGGAAANQYIIALYAGSTSATPPNPGVLANISCNNSAYEFGVNASQPATIAVVADAVAAQACGSSYDCDCPPGYTLVYPTSYVQPITWTQPTGECTETTGDLVAPICRKVTCNCPPPPVPYATTTETGVCDDVYLAGINGLPGYVNSNPKTCNFFFLDKVKPNYKTGSIWRHNYRCDLYANYYGVDYPWEVEFIENTGQVVNTIKSVEYQLESYVYKGDLHHGCGDDRWHDLDFNFDEAILYNTEQVSGLLSLTLNPKEDPYSILQYPIIGLNDIKILYSKEEQKYRFNQFWDVTKDRGEFSNFEQEIFITRLNGYLRDLNFINLDYQKAEDQRKKFRHYHNKVILRRKVSGDRKMLLKLDNTKLNLSAR